jgi:hypothetical protein
LKSYSHNNFLVISLVVSQKGKLLPAFVCLPDIPLFVYL